MHHHPFERIAQPVLWTKYEDVSEFARRMSATLETEIVVVRVEGGWVLPYYVAIWNGYVETDEAQTDRDDCMRLSEEISEASRRDDELKEKEEYERRRLY